MDTDNLDSDLLRVRQRRSFNRQHQAINIIIPSIISAIQHYANPLYNKEAYHTSALSGHAWVLELLAGHPDRI